MRVAAGFAVLLMLVGCVPNPLKYYYVLLGEADGLEVVAHGTTFRTGFLQHPMPLHYRLSRASLGFPVKRESEGTTFSCGA